MALAKYLVNVHKSDNNQYRFTYLCDGKAEIIEEKEETKSKKYKEVKDNDSIS